MTIRDLIKKIESEWELVGYSSEEDTYTTIPMDEAEAYYDYSVVSVYAPNDEAVIVIEFYLD